jgi:predicted membrane protein
MNSYSYNGPPLTFAISLNRLPTLGLDVTTSSGDVNLNLAPFNVNRLNVSTASGAVQATLPAGSGVYPVNTVSASGDVTYTLADDVAVQFESIQTSSGNVTINGGNGGAVVGTMVNTSSGRITLNFGQHPITAGFRVGTSSGDIVVNVPDGVPVRLEVVSNASGTVSVPAGMTQTNGQGNLGVWQTADYPETGQRIEIIVTSTASGDVTLQ